MHEISIYNGWNTQVVQILCKECDDKLIFKGYLISRTPKPVELSHEWVLKMFKYREPEIYARWFDESEKGPFEVPPGRTKKQKKRKSVSGATELYVLQGVNSACMFY